MPLNLSATLQSISIWSVVSNTILKKERLETVNVEEAHENPEDFKKTASTAS